MQKVTNAAKLQCIRYKGRCLFSKVLGGCPLSGKSSMCMMCLKYRIILLLFFILLTYFLLRGAAPNPAGALTAPLRPQLVCTPPSVASTFSHSKYHSHFLSQLGSSASTVSPSSD